MNVVYTDKAPAAIGPYSQAIILNGVLFTSGQIPVDPATGEIAGDTIEAQAEQVMKNLEAVAKEAGTDLANAVKQPVSLRIWVILRHLMRFMQNIS